MSEKSPCSGGIFPPGRRNLLGKRVAAVCIQPWGSLAPVAVGVSTIFEVPHGMSDEDRDAYVREVTAVAAPRARLLIVAFPPGSFPVRGIAPADVEQRFSPGWELLSTEREPGLSVNGKFDARYYLFARAS